MFGYKQRIKDLERKVDRLFEHTEELRDENNMLRGRTSIHTGEREKAHAESVSSLSLFYSNTIQVYTPIDTIIALICDKLNIEFENIPEETSEAKVIIKKKDRSNKRA